MAHDLNNDPVVVEPRRATTESRGWRIAFTLLALAYLAFFLILPLVAVFVEAFRKGGGEFFICHISDPETMAAIKLTLLVSAIAVPLNLVFGVAASWAIAKYEFRGKAFLTTLIDLPFSVSPVISGLVFVLCYLVRAACSGHSSRAMASRSFSPCRASCSPRSFVTFPFVARELVPLMQEQGTNDEQAALSLGASGWQTFWYVTLPNIKWALLYGVLLCNARAMGEFGAVSVVSGHIRGLTNTMPLHIEILYNEYNFVGAFAVATLLAAPALVTLILKSLLEIHYSDALKATRKH